MEPLSLPAPVSGETQSEEDVSPLTGTWTFPGYADTIVRLTLIKVFEIVHPRFQPWYRIKRCTIDQGAVHGVFANRVTGRELHFSLSMEEIMEYCARLRLLET
jgi:hypothetical protein